MIYATPFDPKTLKPTAVGSPCGFETVAQVVRASGDGFVSRGERFVIYGAEDAQVIFSDIDYGANNR